MSRSTMLLKVEPVEEPNINTDTTMTSPSHIHSDTTLRLSEIENAHLCPSARMKIEELFRQWLNVEGTKELIYGLVTDIRAGKEIHIESYAISHNVDHLHSPQRSPKRPPNYHTFGGSPSSSASNSPLMHGRKKPQLVSLFGDELHALSESEKIQQSQQVRESTDIVMNESDADSAMETSENNIKADKPKNLIPRFYIPGETRRGRLRGLSTDTVAKKTVC